MKSSAQVPNELVEPRGVLRKALSLTFLGLSFWLVMWIGNLWVASLTSSKAREIQDAIYTGSGYFYFRTFISLAAFVLITIGTLKLVRWEGVTKSRADTVRIVVVGGILFAILTGNLLQVSPAIFYVVPLISQTLNAIALFTLFLFCTSIVDASKETPDVFMRQVTKSFFVVSLIFACSELGHFIGGGYFSLILEWIFALGSFAIYAFIYFKTLRALPLD